MGWGEGDEVITSPFSFVASANSLLYEGATPVFCDIDPVTLNIDPEAAAAGGRRAHRRASCPSTSSATRPTMPALEALAADTGLGILEDAARRSARSTARDARSAPRGQPRDLRLLREQADDHGGGGLLVTPRPRGRGARARASATRAAPPDMGWLEHDRLGFNYRLSDLQAAIGIAQVERLDELLNARANVAALYRERLTQLGAAPAGDRGTARLLPCENRGDERRSWFVFVVQLPQGADRDAVIASLAEQRHRLQGLPALHPPLPPYASASASARASSRSPSASPSARWRCRSSPR